METTKNELSADDQAIMNEITENIKLSCSKSDYTLLCNRISTDAGLAWVINGCIHLMSKEHFKLSGCLAFLENELEGMG